MSVSTFVIAIAIGVGIMAFAFWAVRLLATPAPPEPDPEDLIEVSHNYRCSVCGMKLTITAAQDDDAAAPRHCREEMIPA
ncbi:MAG: hypothetical protein KJO36_02660 [Acidimicrobiia bacterium]|nr:hypothetical protein [Acidimicrobiia bacterium]MBT8250942.1 hypothetical protein [Acidimicrobiia bacterium]NNL29108.1 hypothetical protein [Acidimicrobiia bacterium]NNL46945.1 hypothetical protein [Acidimicrobiia bacterium]